MQNIFPEDAGKTSFLRVCNSGFHDGRAKMNATSDEIAAIYFDNEHNVRDRTVVCMF